MQYKPGDALDGKVGQLKLWFLFSPCLALNQWIGEKKH
jgi:hypothetical protein